MRSYYEHLAAISSSVTEEPILRSSAIFPVWHNDQISTRLLFLGYWLLKRSIVHLQATITLRGKSGTTLASRTFPITEAKAYRIEAADLLKDKNAPFEGSIELEFLSDNNLVFPFPAAVVNYYGDNFSTVVHTAQRTYNNAEDENRNSVLCVPESGFNLYAENGRRPFVTLINGSKACAEQSIRFTIYNLEQEKMEFAVEEIAFKPYEMKTIDFPSSLMAFLKGKAGTCKIHFHLSGVFPRLLVGNKTEDPFTQVVTHTYYDCSEEDDESQFWNPRDPSFYSASLMVPLLRDKDHETTIDLYPIYSPSPFSLSLEIYDQNGTSIKKLPHFLTLETNADKFQRFRLSDYCRPGEQPLAARIISEPLTNKPIPARIKVALDIGLKNAPLACNICTNLQPYIPAFKEKKRSFKWAPLLADRANASAFIMNSSPSKEYKDKAPVELKFYREKDTSCLTRNITIAPNGFYLIQPDKDPELKTFLSGEIGWFTAVTTNPYTTTYYFSENAHGATGGDHGF